MMRSEIRIAAALAVAFLATACSDSGTDPGDTIPRVELVAVASAPTAPAGTIARCYTGADGATQSANCPVIKWNNVVYWIFEYEDGRTSLNLVAFDLNENQLSASERTGTRFLYDITVSEQFQTVSLFGQNAIPAVVPWSVLEAAQDND